MLNVNCYCDKIKEEFKNNYSTSISNNTHIHVIHVKQYKYQNHSKPGNNVYNYQYNIGPGDSSKTGLIAIEEPPFRKFNVQNNVFM